MAGWSLDIQVLKSDVSGLLQLVSYVKFKVKAGSGGVVLGPMKYFPPVFCSAERRPDKSDLRTCMSGLQPAIFEIQANRGPPKCVE